MKRSLAESVKPGRSACIISVREGEAKQMPKHSTSLTVDLRVSAEAQDAVLNVRRAMCGPAAEVGVKMGEEV